MAAEGMAVVVTPGARDSSALSPVAVGDPGPGQVRVKTLAVGVCGTDVEITSGGYGQAPAGSKQLVIGHESLLMVDALGPGVSGWAPGQLAVAIVRRPCPERCEPCSRGRWDLCVTGNYLERGIKGLDGFMRTALVEDAAFLVPVPSSLQSAAVLVEPLSVVTKAVEEALRLRDPGATASRRALVTGAGPIGLLAAMLFASRGLEVWVADRRPEGSPKANVVTACGGRYIDTSATNLANAVGGVRFDLAMEATGYAPLIFQAAALLARDGALVLTGVTSGHHSIDVDANSLNRAMVLENQIIAGSVNACRAHYEAAVASLEKWQTRWPGLAERLITGRFPLERYREALSKDVDAIKSVVTF